MATGKAMTQGIAQLTKQIESGYITILKTEIPRNKKVFLQNVYVSGALNVGMTLDVSNYNTGNYSYIIYVRDNDGDAPADGTTIVVNALWF